MSAYQFTIGDTWIIEGPLSDDDGNPLPVTGTRVDFVMATTPPIVMSTDETLGGIEWTSEADAAVQIVIRPDQQPPGLLEGVYPFQIRAVLANGVRSTQEEGTITALGSLL